MKTLAILLMLCLSAGAQEYYYDDCLVRDSQGKFRSLGKSGYFEIEGDSICLFDQRINIQSSRLIFDRRSVNTGRMYTCTDGSHVYTMFLTTTNELFFYTKEGDMIKFLLRKTQHGRDTITGQER